MSTPRRPHQNRLPRVAGDKLQAIRRRHFQLFPLCTHCEDKGRIALAQELDHIVSLERGGLDFDRDGGKNRQGLCRACHDTKTRKERGLRSALPRIGVDGFPLDDEET
jgi:5-methylcytosine-specific restriction endonuclease McrA